MVLLEQQRENIQLASLVIVVVIQGHPGWLIGSNNEPIVWTKSLKKNSGTKNETRRSILLAVGCSNHFHFTAQGIC